jgi:EAL domain-containing protein (putative c-di-GMP-specific phosphodiesterase class I)
LEVTESAAFTHFDLCKSVLNELCRRTGALLVVDDFGAGYSNLQRLVELEPSIVKLDLKLTRDIHRRSRQRAVVRHMVNLCTELGARVVAEGVEQRDELFTLRDLGVHYAQGYFLARPAAPPPAVDWPQGVNAAHVPPGQRPPPPPPRRRVSRRPPPTSAPK